MNNQTLSGGFFVIILFLLFACIVTGTLAFNDMNSPAPVTQFQMSTKKLELAEKEVARLTNRLNSRQHHSNLLKERYEKVSKELKETKKSLGGLRGEMSRLNAKVAVFERRSKRQGSPLSKDNEQEVVSTYRLRFYLSTRGRRRRRTRTGNIKPAITKEIEATSFRDATQKIREQFVGARIVTIEIVE